MKKFQEDFCRVIINLKKKTMKNVAVLVVVVVVFQPNILSLS